MCYDILVNMIHVFVDMCYSCVQHNTLVVFVSLQCIIYMLYLLVMLNVSKFDRFNCC